MPKISYKYVIENDLYDDFKSDISEIAQKLNFQKLSFNDEERSVLFDCDDAVVEDVFRKDLTNSKKGERYGFFFRRVDRRQNCQRFEDGQTRDFVVSHAAETALYQQLKKNVREQKIIRADEIAQKAQTQSLTLGEYHPDPSSKRKLRTLLESFKDREDKPLLVLERIPSSLNDEISKWLQDGSADSELPLVIKHYCDFIDLQNAKEIWPNAKPEELEEIAHSEIDILKTAKACGFKVIFMESEHSKISIGVENSRHMHLVTSMQHLADENPGHKFILFCGAFHDTRSEEAEVILSDVVGGTSYEAIPEFFAEKLMATAHKYQGSGIAEFYKQMAAKYQVTGDIGITESEKAKQNSSAQSVTPAK